MKSNSGSGIADALVRETPGKVVSLLTASLFSLAFMFAVSATDASFVGSKVALADPFAPEKVMAVIDSTASSYSQFLSANFLQPLASDYRVYGDNLAYVFKESGMAYALGIEKVAAGDGQTQSQPKVAGTFTQKTEYHSGGFGIDTLYSVLIR